MFLQNQIGSLVHAMTVKGWTKFAVLAQIRKMERIYHIFEEMVEEQGGEIVQENNFMIRQKQFHSKLVNWVKTRRTDGEELEGFKLPPVVEFEALFVPDNCKEPTMSLVPLLMKALLWERLNHSRINSNRNARTRTLGTILKYPALYDWWFVCRWFFC